MTETLTYGDVTLRPLLVSDCGLLWELYEPEIFEFMLNRIESKEQLEKWLCAGIHQMNVDSTALAFVVENTITKEIMGTTRIYAMDQSNNSCEIGSTFYGKQYQRTHVNTTCKYMLLKYCFEQMGMIRVQFKTDELNLASQRAIERIGGVKEGILRNERIRSNGSVRNAVVYSIIESEWSEVKYKLVQLMNKYS
ncbi:GNAT family N-acetyltransferase [Psychrobacillus psychrodurans]|uniref:GNAT family N-acetyltransferase n=1 Tax=Psychrobacillus psychrodurans TaxID=126157 RepID=A0A9X3LBB7_9BACI|nr:GNAT family protein [Psychrobacillus psychrodurans]MCZ8534642.1 GNAT family N-acetyltransferase [Psychrobacillus psychrodurans]